MALRRKKHFDDPVKCSLCKKKQAYHTMHGGYVPGGGQTICDECYPQIKEKERPSNANRIMGHQKRIIKRG